MIRIIVRRRDRTPHLQLGSRGRGKSELAASVYLVTIIFLDADWVPALISQK